MVYEYATELRRREQESQKKFKVPDLSLEKLKAIAKKQELVF